VLSLDAEFLGNRAAFQLPVHQFFGNFKIKL
jgi:hypothetical protein